MMRLALTLLCLGALPGCASVSKTSTTPVPETPVQSSTRTDTLLARLGGQPVGLPTTLAAGNVLGSRRATVVSAYQAASGRRCRRLDLDGGEQRLICLQANGAWALQRRIGPMPPAERVGISGSEDKRAGVVDVLESGETLWAFSVRTTGDGSNWQEIAQASSVPDADRVAAGTALHVPGDLVLGGTHEPIAPR